MNAYELPVTAQIGGKIYQLNTDFRTVLRIIGYLSDPELPPLFGWLGAIALFYREEVAAGDTAEAAAFIAEFISCGQDAKNAPRLMDWQQDADAIMADLSAVAGEDVRSKPYLHWWSFLALFQGIGQGQLSLRVSIRDKLRRGQKLEPWEREYCRTHRDKVTLRPIETQAQRQERQRLEKLLG